MRKLKREIHKGIVSVSNVAEQIIYLYERLKNDANGNRKYQVTIIYPYDNDVEVFTTQSNNIGETVKNYLNNEQWA